MSEEVVKEETNDKSVQMFVHQIDFGTLKNVLSKVTDVSLLFTYNMPNKAVSYIDNGFELIKKLEEYTNGDETWRITKDKQVPLRIIDDKICINEWVIGDASAVLCIPQINTIIIVPDEESTCRGAKEPTKILQLTNCISVTPLLLVLGDEPDTENEGKYRLSVGYQVIG
jgi:hypothetical protein